jgi:peptidoglycan hydrolase CwlO-like protein
MSEKRFQITTNPMSQSVAFDEKQKKYYIGAELEDLLNEQDGKIKELEKENEQLKDNLEKIPPKIKEVWLE